MDKNAKSVVVSHIDLDGFGCNVMAMRYLGRDIPIHNVNYDTLAETLMDIPRNVQLFITDLSIPSHLCGLLEEFSHVIIIDHHVSTSWAIDWAERTDNEAIVDKSRCATWHVYEYLASVYGYRDYMLDEWAKYIDDYDRYVLQYPESRRLNALFYISNRDRFVSDALSYSPKDVLNANRERIDRYLQQQREYIAQTTVFTLNEGTPKVGLFFAEKNKSAIAEALIKDCGMDLLYGVDLHMMAVSLRSSERSRIDCSKIAQMIHPEGGGHRNASGASLDISDWMITKGVDLPLFRMVLNFPVENLPTYEPEEED